MQTFSMVVSLVLSGVLVGAGCGSGSGSSSPGKTLDCNYLASDTNCWKTTVAASTSCLPASTETGTLSANGATCTYASGDVVTFTPPLVLPLSTSGTTTWNFSVATASGAPCLSYKDDGNGNITLTVQGETVKETAPGGFGIALTCSDGTTYSNSNGLSLLSCPDASFLSGLPGNGWSDTNTSISLSLTGASTAYGSQPVFNCQTM